MSRLRSLLLGRALPLAALLLAPALAQAADATVVVEAKLGEGPAEGLTIELIGEPPGGGEESYGEVTTGPDGEARFKVLHRPGVVLHARARHEGLPYRSEDLLIPGDPAAVPRLHLQVYAKGEGATPDDLRIAAGSHIIVEYADEGLDVISNFKIVNTSTRTFAPAEGLIFKVPAAALEANGIAGDPVSPVPGGVSAPGPFLPGESEVRFRYKLPYDTPRVALYQPLPAKGEVLRVIIDNSPGLAAEGVSVIGQTLRDSDGRKLLLVDVGVTSGAVDLTFTGVPLRQTGGRAWALGLALLIAVLGVGFLATARTDRGQGEEAEASATEARGRLLDEALSLEEERLAGELDLEAYHEDRDELVGRLADLLRTQASERRR